MTFGEKEYNKEMASAMKVEDLQFIILPLNPSLVHYAYLLMDKVSSAYHDSVTCVIWDNKTYSANLNRLSSYNKILAIGAMKDAPFIPNGNVVKDSSDGTIIQLSGNHAWITEDFNCSDYELEMIDAKWIFRNDPIGYNQRVKLIEKSYKSSKFADRYFNKFKLIMEDLKYETKVLKTRGYDWGDLFKKRGDDPNSRMELGWWVYGINRFFDNYLERFLHNNEESSI